MSPFNFPWLKYRLLRAAKSTGGYKQLAVKQTELAPAEKVQLRPAFFDEDDLKKITAVQAQTTHAYEMKRIHGGEQHHVPSMAYLLKNVEGFGGNLFKWSMRHRLNRGKDKLLDSSPKQKFSSAALACTYSGNQYFGHWINDDLTLYLLAEGVAPPVRNWRVLTPHQEQYSAVCDIRAEMFQRAHFDQLTIIEDFGQNSSKRGRYRLLRERIRNNIKPATASRGIMLLRGTTGVRRAMLNEAEIADRLAGEGFNIIAPESMTVEQIAAAGGGPLVVGVEGSHLAHGLMTMADTGAVVCLQPPFRFNNIYKDRCDCLDMLYSFMLGDPSGEGFTVDIEQLLKFIERVEKQLDLR